MDIRDADVQDCHILSGTLQTTLLHGKLVLSVQQNKINQRLKVIVLSQLELKILEQAKCHQVYRGHFVIVICIMGILSLLGIISSWAF